MITHQGMPGTSDASRSVRGLGMEAREVARLDVSTGRDDASTTCVERFEWVSSSTPRVTTGVARGTIEGGAEIKGRASGSRGTWADQASGFC